MKLTGIIEESFRGQIIFRGFATLSNLAKVSKPSDDYQREAKSERIDELERYYQDAQYLFFPELIFGWYIDDTSILSKVRNQAIGTFTSGNGVKFKKAKYSLPESNYTIGDNPTKKDFTIEIPDSIVLTKPLNRIDGNHRLSAIDKLLEDESSTGIKDEVCDKFVPYSILLQFASETPESFQDAKKYETAYFYLINSKAKPLTTEENLRAILDGDTFTPLEKEKLLNLTSSALDYIHGVVQFVKTNKIDFVENLFNSDIYSFSHRLVQIIINKGEIFEESELEIIISAIKYVNCLYIKNEIKLITSDIFLALVRVDCAEPDVLDKFVQWINKNEVGSIAKLSCEHIVQLFNNIHKKRAYQVFVAMPYISFKRVNEYNKLFREVLDEISRKEGFGLELIPIMRFRGEAQRIDQRLIESIKKCDIFIGDLTTVNYNVIFEIGLAEGSDKKILLIKAEEDTDKLPFDLATNLDKDRIVPFDLDKLQYIPYSNSGYYNDIKSIMRNNIPVIVAQLKNESHV